MPASALEKVRGCKHFPSDPANITSGRYGISCDDRRKLTAVDSTVKSDILFKSPALNRDTIRKMCRLQLVADSHDQGYADVPSAGNWTWFELAILESESAFAPRVKDGVELVWKSHDNNFLSRAYEWAEGKEFEEQHDLLRVLEDGNVIAVRLCARFRGWEIHVRGGYLTFDFGREEVDREPPPPYGEIVSKVEGMQAVLNEVNTSIQSGFQPSLPEGLYRAELLSTGGGRPLRVLSLDGGGVRGLSSLHLLDAVMTRAAPGKKPCEVFDMIGGTSTGGYIAIMLGRLRMTVGECIQTYQDFMVQIFNKGAVRKTADFLFNGEFYDEGVLERLIKQLVQDKTGDSEAELLEEGGDPACKVFVMAVCQQAGNNRGPLFLRSYRNKQDRSALSDIKIWEAARATSAAPAYFAPITVGEYTLVDGGLGANNPLGWLWTELLAVFGPARATSCFLSIGTGLAANQAILAPGKLGSHAVEAAFAAAACNTELTNILFRSLVNAFAPQPMDRKYWRLNVGEEVPAWDEEKRTWYVFKTYPVHHIADYKDVGKLDDVGALKVLMEMTDRYIKEQDGVIGDCAKSLMAT
ncbi:Calcium-independent phospholipase A2-gamma [Tolypocladium ophioglossoides CBS 100239]|uniref:Calcium-independent phospholipase A2-gamma n=1 Tax=Tolypocladium ophioglossoides (strain CBS 100239) TaxID=1163406 RepID=A0A0L0N9M3_TOLOC|nr:Calcium-independent phospholipase A2-gamma [Tolypocladium ophioglossoides CBS 100239]